MKTLSLCVFLASCSWAIAQETSDLFDKAPPAIDDALRARVKQFYEAHMAGKYREALKLVADTDEDQNAFMAATKSQYKGCETIRINYTDQFTKANVIESCKFDWVFHGQTAPATAPLTTSWKLVDGQWYWHHLKPTVMPSPFSPTGTVNVPPETAATGAGNKSAVPPDLNALAKNILNQVKLDKNAITLQADHTSKDELRVVNQMPGQISFSVDPVSMPGLKITPAKTQLIANEEAAVVFEYRLDDATISCGECAERVHSSLTVNLRVQPTGQVLPITVNFANPKSGEVALPKK